MGGFESALFAGVIGETLVTELFPCSLFASFPFYFVLLSTECCLISVSGQEVNKVLSVIVYRKAPMSPFE